MKSTLKLMMVIIAITSFVSLARAGDNNGWETGYGLNLGSFHLGNKLQRKSGFNEVNLGATLYLTDKGENLPIIDEFSLSFVGRNSYGGSSVYLMAHHNIFNWKYLDVALSAGVATGYKKHLIIADKIGFMPIAGVRLTIMDHLEVGLIPSGVFNKKSGANTIVFTYRF